MSDKYFNPHALSEKAVREIEKGIGKVASGVAWNPVTQRLEIQYEQTVIADELLAENQRKQEERMERNRIQREWNRKLRKPGFTYKV